MIRLFFIKRASVALVVIVAVFEERDRKGKREQRSLLRECVVVSGQM